MNSDINLFFIFKKRNLIWRVKLSKSSIVIMLFLIIFITAGALICLVHNAQVTITETQIAQAIKQNDQFIKKLYDLNDRLQTLKEKVGYQIIQDSRQRSYLQVAGIHPDIWSMGLGGKKPEPVAKNISKNTANILDNLYESIEVLKGQCRLRTKSLKEIEYEFNKNIDLWKHIPSINPVPGTQIGSGFGYRVDPIDKTIRMHDGVDLGAPTGTPILASADGVVSYAGWNMGYGYVVDIDHGYGFLSRYAHCSRILVKEGEFVRRGQIIALVGGTGRTTCPHLHYEVHVSGIKVNPANYIHFKDIIFD